MRYRWIYIMLVVLAVVSGCKTKNTLTTCHTEENKTSSATDNDILSTTENSIFSAMSFCDSLPQLSSQLIERDDSLPGKNYYETLKDSGVDPIFSHSREWCGVIDPFNNIPWLNNLINNLADTLQSYYTIEKAYRHYFFGIYFLKWKSSSAKDSTNLLMTIDISAYGYDPYFKRGMYLYDFNGNIIGSYCNYEQLEEDLQQIYRIKTSSDEPSFINIKNNYRLLGGIVTRRLFH